MRQLIIPTLTAWALALSVHSALAVTAAGRTPGSFAVTPTGAATYSIPIQVPHGPNGLQPDLSIVYNSQAGSGSVGVGWSIAGLSTITRCNNTWAQDGVPAAVTLTYSDRFCLDGNRLRLTSSETLSTYGQDTTTYQTEIANFSNVTAHGTTGQGPSYFTVQGKDGRTYEYGNGANSQVQLNGTASTWALDKVTDRAGNTMTIAYVAPGANLVGSTIPATISWTPSTAGSTSYNYTMTFSYNPTATALRSGYVAGNATLLSELLFGIVIANAGTTVKNYVFNYTPSPTTGEPTLTSLQECADSAASNCLAPTSMVYQPGAVGAPTPATSSGSGATNGYVKTVDIDGDGRSDLVFAITNANGTYQWWVQLATASGFRAPINTGASTPAAGAANLLLDAFDGTPGNEILAPNGSTFSLYKYNPSTQTFTSTPTNLSVLAATLYASADVDGDGRPDVVYLGAAFTGQLQIARNTTTGTAVSFAAAVPTTIPYSCTGSCVPQLFGNNQISYTPVKKFDFDGDGRQDLLLWETAPGAGTAITLLSRGMSGFVVGVALPDGNAGAIPVNWNNDGCTDITAGATVYVSRCNGAAATIVTLPTWPFMALDWNGDGLTDLVVQTGGNYFIYQSTGTGYTSTQIYTFGIGGGTTVLDKDGDGLDDVACSCGTNSALLFGLHAGAGQKPDLLTAVTDGNGTSISPSYVSIAQGSYTASTDAVFPDQNYTGSLYVVNKATFTDPSTLTAGTTYNQTFAYVGAWTNLQGRGFEGFYSKSTMDSRTTALAPPSGLNDTQYFERAFPNTGMLFQDIVSNGTFSLSQSVATLPATPMTLDANATAYNQRYFAYFTNWLSKKWEFNGNENADLIRTTSTTYGTPDNYGNYPTITTVVTDNDPGSPYGSAHGSDTWTTTTTNTLDVDAAHWCLTLLTEQQIAYTASNGSTPVTRTKSLTPDMTNCRYTQIVTEPSSATYKVTEVLGYDSFGNISSDAATGIGMTTRTTGITWSAAGQFPATVTNALTQQTVLVYDSTWGKPTSVTDPNGIKTQWTYDAFGRKNKETRPDGTYTLWAYQDCAASGGCLIGPHAVQAVHTVYNGDGSVLTDGTDYADPLDRPLVMTSRMLAGGAYSRNELRYDSLGNVAWAAAPCPWSAITTPCASGTTYTHDALNRVTQSQRSSFNPTVIGYAGRTTTITDPNGHAKNIVEDVNGWLRQAKDANGYTVTLAYDAAGGKTGTTDSQGRTLWSGTVQYGISAFTVAATDASLGSQQYTYDAFGDVIAWIDAKGQSFSASYDAISRPKTRTEPDFFTQWTWGASAASHNIGKLQGVCTGTGINPTACSMTGYSEAETYDGAGRRTQRAIAIPGYGTFNYGYAFNSTTGLLSTLTYPVSTQSTALQLQYNYANGLLTSIKDISDSPNVTVWAANTSNPAGQITQETLGNGVVINRNYDAVNQWLNSVTAGVGVGATLENQGYLHDPIGNVTQRQENNLGLTENFYYDKLNRLYYSQLTVPQAGTVTNLQMCYDNTGSACTENLPGPGNITSKTADATAPLSYTTAWTSYNYPASIASSSESVAFSYGPDRRRWQQNYDNGAEVTNYIGGLLEEVVTSAGTDYRHTIYAGSEPVAIYSRKSTLVNTWSYLLLDHQGGVAAITNSAGSVSESFTAYGARRDPAVWSGAPSATDLTTIAGLSRQGYTFQTALGQSMGFNHMNGRVQDAITGQFLSPDPRIPDPTNTQDYNRYAYVNNNPLSHTDPSGFDLDEVIVTASRDDGSDGFDNGGAGGGGSGSQGGTAGQNANAEGTAINNLHKTAALTASTSNKGSGFNVINAAHAVEAVTVIVIGVGLAPVEVPLALAFVAVTGAYLVGEGIGELINHFGGD